MSASLTDADIPGLRQRIGDKVTTVAEEADRYGVAPETIRRAVRGDSFRHVREGLPTSGKRPTLRLRPANPLPSLEEEAKRSLEGFLKKEEEQPPPSDALDDIIKRKDKE